VQTQAQNTIQDDSNLKCGVSISASYGPSVNVKSDFDYGSNTANSDSQDISTSYGKDIATRSVSKVTQEVSQQQHPDIINSFKERVEHGFDNTNGPDNISGVYQYVDALYEVAAFIRDAIKVANGGAVTAYDPPPITFSPSDLTLPVELLGPGNQYPAIAQLKPATYVEATTYPAGALVTFNETPYVSLQAANTGNEPDTSPAWWGSVLYSAAAAYPVGAVAIYQGQSYLSLKAGNTGNEPDISPTWWSPNGPMPGSATQTDYSQAAQIYQVTGLKPPPDPYVTPSQSEAGENLRSHPPLPQQWTVAMEATIFTAGSTIIYFHTLSRLGIRTGGTAHGIPRSPWAPRIHLDPRTTRL
jgi:hypothetical protein